MLPKLVAAAGLLSLLPLAPAVPSPQGQGPCQTGCEVTAPAPLSNSVYGLNGEFVQTAVTSFPGTCMPMLTEAGIDCFYSGCQTSVQYAAVGFTEGEEVWTCHDRDLTTARTDCVSPPPLIGADGESETYDFTSLACGSAPHKFSTRVGQLIAPVILSCGACD